MSDTAATVERAIAALQNLGVDLNDYDSDALDIVLAYALAKLRDKEREPPMAESMTNEEIRALALAHGFTLREQPDGSTDLNHYVYTFAMAMYRKGRSKRLAEIRAEVVRDAEVEWHANGLETICSIDCLVDMRLRERAREE